MEIWLNGLGSYLPTRALDNESFLALAGLDALRIPGRITRRFLAPPEVGTLEMAVVAAREALAQEPELARAIGLVAVASTFPGTRGHHRVAPAMALARKLDLPSARSVDLATPLLGFHDALGLAVDALRNGEVRAALVVGAEGFSQVTQLKDRRISHLLSDGAGALLLSVRPGFARIGPVRFGANEVADGGDLVADMIAIDEGAARRVALENPGPDQLLAQLVGDPNGQTPGQIRVHNPFGEVGHLLSASVPLSLHDWLVTQRPEPGSTCRLFSTTGEHWATCELALTAAPSLPALDAPAREHVPGGSALVLVSGERLPGRVRELADSTLRYASRLCFIGLRVDAPDADDRLQQRINAETSAILRRHLRITDRLFQLEHQSTYALFLRGIDHEDTKRLCDRLTTVLQRLDLAGELQIDVAATTLELVQDQDLAGFVDRVTSWLS